MEKKKGRILIVDDNVQILSSLQLLLKSEFAEISTLKNPNQIPFVLQSGHFDIVLLDMNFRSGDNTGNEGLYWLTEILKRDPQVVVIMITAYGDIDLAVKAIKRGATDFISKPWDAEKLIVTLTNSLEIKLKRVEVKKLQGRQRQLSEDMEKQFRLFRGISKKMEQVYKTIDKVALTDANVLILGENGTGKEVIAREIHKRSLRAAEIFLSVDMGSISETLFESEMFGHVKGSFTDAREDRTGRFEAASGGTLFMDEIANLSMPAQSKLLGVLQSYEITRLGSNNPVKVDFRLISATNKIPAELIHQNLFREDLLFRINTIQIELPPLRERTEDIPGLAEYFLKQFALKYGKPGLKMTGDTYDALADYHWPGNIRELKHTIEKAVILSDTDLLKPDNLGLRSGNTNIYAARDRDGDTGSLSDIERNAIIRALERFDGNVTKAAKLLEISRTTLYSKAREYGIPL
ncbi:MAG: sigma-54-dependent Fis family transcriptional regulator [Bacteroidales bacterium]|nr:sigma-54-dependent Fis family transcriptional regulator [Bacteroidales bacterium]